MSIFGYPEPGTKLFSEVACFINRNNATVTTVLPWFSSQIIDCYGIQKSLIFLGKYGSLSVATKTILKELPDNSRFEKVLHRNCAEGGYVEIQSASSFWQCLRIVKLNVDCHHLSSSRIAHITGLSQRTVQRHLRSSNSNSNFACDIA